MSVEFVGQPLLHWLGMKIFVIFLFDVQKYFLEDLFSQSLVRRKLMTNLFIEIHSKNIKFIFAFFLTYIVYK